MYDPSNLGASKTLGLTTVLSIVSAFGLSLRSYSHYTHSLFLELGSFRSNPQSYVFVFKVVKYPMNLCAILLGLSSCRGRLKASFSVRNWAGFFGMRLARGRHFCVD